MTSGPRLAANPANALLNYLYALLEGEATLAARLVGLDPGLGVMHADQANRDSLASDLMEPIRPLVDRLVLDLLATRTFSVADFHETRQGVCRLTPAIAAELTAFLPRLRKAVGRVAEDVAARLETKDGPGRTTPTPISERNRSDGRPASGSRRVAKRDRGLEARCTWCDGPVVGKRRTCGPECEAQARASQDIGSFVMAGAARMRDLRAKDELTILDASGVPSLKPSLPASGTDASVMEGLCAEQRSPCSRSRHC